MADIMVLLLRELGWSQAELASRLDVSSTTVSRWRVRGCPVAAIGYMAAMLEMRRSGEHLVALTRMPPRGSRGRHDSMRRALSAEELARRALARP